MIDLADSEERRDSEIQYKASIRQRDYGFSENGDPVPLAQPPSVEDDPVVSELRRTQQAVAVALLRLIAAKDAPPKVIGIRVLLLLFMLRRGDFANRKELAARMGVTEARVCQHLKDFRKELPAFSGLS